MLNIYVDADGCPVKDEVYRVAGRLKLKVFLVANKWLNAPQGGVPVIEMVVVSDGMDVADDWIVEHCEKGDVVITTDLPLADRCIKRGARVLGPKGNEHTEDSIGGSLANRELMSHLRGMGEMTGGPAPMTPKDRSQFLGALDRVIQQLKRDAGVK